MKELEEDRRLAEAVVRKYMEIANSGNYPYLSRIAQELGVTRSKLSIFINKYGLQFPDISKTVVESKLNTFALKNEYENMLSSENRVNIAKLAEKFGCKYSTIRRALNNMFAAGILTQPATNVMVSEGFRKRIEDIVAEDTNLSAAVTKNDEGSEKNVDIGEKNELYTFDEHKPEPIVNARIMTREEADALWDSLRKSKQSKQGMIKNKYLAALIPKIKEIIEKNGVMTFTIVDRKLLLSTYNSLEYYITTHNLIHDLEMKRYGQYLKVQKRNDVISDEQIKHEKEAYKKVDDVNKKLIKADKEMRDGLSD